MNPFEEWTVYGPYDHKNTGRRMIALVSENKRTSMSYARYLMCLNEDRWIRPDEHVDHIDNDKTNDVLSNLQILTQAENTRKSATGRTLVTLQCPVCDADFTRERRQTHLVKGGGLSCCSRSCAGKRNAVT